MLFILLLLNLLLTSELNLYSTNMKTTSAFFTFGIICISFLGCLRETPQIKVVTERVAPNKYSFRWEVLPPMNGTVKIYSSLDPEHFDLSKPLTEASISDGAAYVQASRESDRYFFLLKFNNRCKKVIASRFIYSPRIQNLRDIGGYQNKEEKTIKWAKIYRSANIKGPMAEKDICLTNKLCIKTIISFYSKKGETYKQENPQINNIHYINTDIPDPVVPAVIDMVLKGRMKKGDARLYLQKQYLDMYEKADIYFKPMFNTLLDEESYPVLLTDERGTDRVGFAVALLMAAIDVPEETVIDDYMLSFNQANIRDYIPRGTSLFLEQQETIALLLNPQEKALSVIFAQIDQEFGSIDNYLEKKLKLDKAKRKKLKQLLLY